MTGNRILVVDDNEAIHQDIRIVLKDQRARRNRLQALEASVLSGDLSPDAKTSTPDKNQSDNKTHTSPSHPGPDIRPQKSGPHYQIESAFQGEAAITMVAQAEKQGSQYDLIFVDIRMPPGIDGVETIKGIWAINPNIEIVICSAYSDYDWDDLVDALGSRHNLLILRKPFDPLTVKQIALSQTQKSKIRHQVNLYQEHLEETIESRTVQLQHSMTILDNILNATGEAILAFDEADSLIRYNAFGEAVFNLQTDKTDDTPDDLSFSEILEPLSIECHQILQDHAQLIHNPKANIFGILNFENGDIYEYHAAAQQGEQNSVSQVWCFRNVTELKQKEAAMQHQAYHDVLTDLPNRLLLLDRIALARAQSESEGNMFSILFIDLDFFKKVNDSAGHKVGDELLRSAANRIKKCIRQRDTLARIGGDEFIVLVNGVNSHSMASKYAREIIARLEQHFILEDKPFHISCSIGISMFPQDDTEAEELIRKADLAMFDAKAKGRGKYTFFSPPLEHLAVFHYQVESQLRHAIEHDRLSLHYQPVLDASTMEITKVEALIRWQPQEGTTIYPDQFIAIAEKSDLIKRLGFWVIEQVCQQIKVWYNLGLTHFRVAINFSPNQFADRTLITSLLNTMSRHGISGEHLEIEITETALIESVDAVSEMLNYLKQNNITIAIDDFGTGYSSMSYLRSLPIDNIKIDRTFVGNMHLSDESRTIVNAVISLAHNLKLKVAAEGVENEPTADLLRGVACDYLQGFHYFRPIPAEEITQLLLEDLSNNANSKKA